ncbi:hypothetical protein [Clostridium novyi]|uniref:Conserved protein, putative n=2 Tax=Clostridium novyi TaxID=1542 RepID=A0Q081_CLONN|nr:hypothetical protein [Clostridium novyi]ABK61586.1 conserved protein, putative [Clostridium novyi NT]KEH85485.1 hypothetical protein Z966_06895 [Clostridium novyi A str. NCTC 538]
MNLNKFIIYKKKGLCILEPLCALAILSIFIVYLSNIQIKTFHLKNQNQCIDEYIKLSENLKNNLKYNLSYKELESSLLKDHSENNFYINQDNLNIDSIRKSHINKLISKNKLNEIPYAQITIRSLEKGVIKVDINLKVKCNGRIENINSYFYKGDYYT